MPNSVPTTAVLLVMALAAGASSAVAQDAGPGPSGGGPGGPEAPGAYASPSAIPNDPASVDLGIPSAQGLKRFEPIELPNANLGQNPADFALPALPMIGPQSHPTDRILLPNDRSLVLKATLGKDGPEIPDHLVWRLFSPTPESDGKLPVIAVAKGGQAVFDVPQGSYLLHVAYGRAGLTRRIEFAGTRSQEVMALEAGGLRLNALSGDKSVPTEKLRFDIFTAATEENHRQLVARNVEPGVVVRLNAGDYEVVSNYGTLNATVRADIRIETGRITDATLQHHAAQLTLKLVREHGGEAIADTAWSITSVQGDPVKDSIVGAFASLVLAEGDYVVVARNRERIFQRQFEVKAGIDTDLEVLTSDLVDPNSPDVGTGD